MSEPRDHTLPAGRSLTSPAAAPARWMLTVLHSPDAEQVGRRIRIEKPITVGRVAAPDVALAIDDPRMSRAHATFARAGLVLELHDLASRNGCFVNGERVTGDRGLGIGDIVRVGDTLLEVGPHADPPAAADATLTGRSPALLAALALADRAARSELPVLLLGETGTGKELLARRVHAGSGRPGPLVGVNCAALPRELVESTLFGHRKGAFTGATADAEGFFAQADDGSIFLDEIGELPLAQQAKLLRVLESGEYVPVGSSRVLRSRARVIAATNVDLAAETASGGFRADLYARLAGAVIALPPLRARRGDILELAGRFLAELAPAAGFHFSANAAEALLLHAWPRNVRELRTAMQRLVLLQPAGGEVSHRVLDGLLDAVAPPARAGGEPSPRRSRGGGAPDREELVARLTALRGNVNRLAEHYGKDPKQIYRWLKQHDLDPASFRT